MVITLTGPLNTLRDLLILRAPLLEVFFHCSSLAGSGLRSLTQLSSRLASSLS
jgi:hypothetical protein